MSANSSRTPKVAHDLERAGMPKARHGYRYRVTQADLALAADPWAPSKARDLLMSVMADQAGSDGLHRALLGVSEVVTNAVSHGVSDESDRISLLVERTEDLVIVRVIQTRPVPQLPSIAIMPEGWSIGGYGLGVLDAVADRWGVGLDPPSVWFELDL
jgi:anti-sigma regulatory factor (Ser/Thr protein kinase)